MGSMAPFSVKYLTVEHGQLLSERNENWSGSDVPVYPIRNIQAPVNSERGEVVCCNGLGLSRALEHEQLGQDGNRLEVDGERPENFEDREFVVADEGKNKGRANDIFKAESIDRRVVGRSEEQAVFSQWVWQTVGIERRTYT